MFFNLLGLTLILHCGAPAETNPQRIEGSVFRTGKLVKQGDRVELVCPSSRPWFFCVWKSPLGEKHCATNMNQVLPACKNTRLNIHGNNSSCSIDLQVGSHDHGAWSCLITYDLDYQTQKMFIDLEVSLPPSEVNIFEISSQRVSNKTDRKSLHVEKTEEDSLEDLLIDDQLIQGESGQLITVTCSAFMAYPRPVYSWDLYSNGENEKPRDFEVVDQQFEIVENHYWINSSQAVRFRMESEMNNSLLICSTRQYDRLSGDLVLETQKTIKLMVSAPPPLPFKTLRARTRGVVLLLFLLVCTTGLCVCLLGLPLCYCRRWQKRKDDDPFTNQVSQSCSLESISKLPQNNKQISTLQEIFPNNNQITTIQGLKQNNDDRKPGRSSDSMHLQFGSDGLSSQRSIPDQLDRRDHSYTAYYRDHSDLKDYLDHTDYTDHKNRYSNLRHKTHSVIIETKSEHSLDHAYQNQDLVEEGTRINGSSEYRTRNQDSFDNRNRNQSSNDRTTDLGSIDDKTRNLGSIDDRIRNPDFTDDRTRNQGSIDDRVRNQGSIVDRTINQGSIDDRTRNQRSIGDRTRNQGSIDDKTRNQSSIDDRTRNQGSIDDRTRNQGSIYKTTDPDSTENEDESAPVHVSPDKMILSINNLSRTIPANISESISGDLNDSSTRLYVFGSEEEMSKIFPSSPIALEYTGNTGNTDQLEPKKKQSLFYCNEGCFRQDSPCTHSLESVHGSIV